MKFGKWSNFLKLVLLRIIDELEKRITNKNELSDIDSLSQPIFTSLKFMVLEQVDGLVDNVISYSKSQVNSLADLVAQRVSVIMASLVYVLIILGLIFLVFMFFCISLALYLGEVCGATYYGFLITGGIILGFFLIFNFIGHNRLARYIKQKIMQLV